MTLRDFAGGRAKTEDIKKYLGRYITWDDWWEKAQSQIKSAPHIDTSRARTREYSLRREALSPAEEAYQNFRERRLLGDRTRAYSEARRALQLSTTGQYLGAEAKNRLLGFFEDLRTNPQQPIGQRLDLVFRLVEAHWLAEALGDVEIEQLLTPSLRLHDLDEYAQNRLLRLLERRVPSEAGLQLLVSGLAGAHSVVKSAKDRIIHLGEPRWIAAALQSGLTENLPEKPAESQTFAVRLQASFELANSLPATETDWPTVAGWFESLCAHCAAKVASREQLAKFYFSDVARLALALYSGAQAGQPDCGILVLGAGFNIQYGTSYLTGVFLAAQMDARVPPAFVEVIRGFLGQNAGLQHDALRAVLFRDDRLPADEQVRHLTNVACDWSSHEANFDWAAGQVIELAKQMDPGRLIAVLPHLDRLSLVGHNRDWHSALEAQRERGYSFGLRELSSQFSTREAARLGNLDSTVLDAIRSFGRDQSAHLEEQLAKQQKQMTALEERCAILEADLVRRDTALSELKRGRARPDQEIQFEERTRLLRDLASSVAELERFSSRQVNPAPEAKAMLLRLGNLLRANGVEARGALGRQVAFDSAYFQIIGNDPVATGEMVEVAETGYDIKDNQGVRRLLKPALVKRIEPSP